MADSIVCAGDPGLLSEAAVCLSSVSKDAVGKLALVESEPQKCREIDCVTLKTVHELNVELDGHTCDSKAGNLFDGSLEAKLVHAYEDGSGLKRGVHSGEFGWNSKAGSVSGTMSGITNAGLFRAPPFDAHERCLSRGIMYGRLCGVIESRDKLLNGCELIAVYRLRFKATAKGGSGKITGSIEGNIVCRC